MKLVLAHLYPSEMNIYGDMGNITVLCKRLEWRGYSVEYHPVNITDKYDFTRADIVFGGGGQDKGQIAVADDLQRHRKNIQAAVEDGAAFLLICGLYQLFGHQFTPITGGELPGIGIFNAETHGGEERLIGNVVAQTSWGELVGFENHSGRTELVAGQSALGRVSRGYGNNGRDGFEGAVTKNAFGTYLHGSLLPKNPQFADELLSRALTRKLGSPPQLAPLETIDTIAAQAAETAKSRPQ